MFIPCSPAPTVSTIPPAHLERAGRNRSWWSQNLTPATLAESASSGWKKRIRAGPDSVPAGWLFRRRRAGGQRQIHCGLLPQSPAITEAVHALLKQRDGLMLGICNGFQALVKLGLVPLWRAFSKNRRLVPHA